MVRTAASLLIAAAFVSGCMGTASDGPTWTNPQETPETTTPALFRDDCDVGGVRFYLPEALLGNTLAPGFTAPPDTPPGMMEYVVLGLSCGTRLGESPVETGTEWWALLRVLPPMDAQDPKVDAYFLVDGAYIDLQVVLAVYQEWALGQRISKGEVHMESTSTHGESRGSNENGYGHITWTITGVEEPTPAQWRLIGIAPGDGPEWSPAGWFDFSFATEHPWGAGLGEVDVGTLAAPMFLQAGPSFDATGVGIEQSGWHPWPTALGEKPHQPGAV